MEGLVYRELIEDALRKLTFERPAGADRGAPGNLALATPVRRGHRRWLAVLTQAAEGRKQVTLSYASEARDLTERPVDPYAIVHRAGE